MSFFKKLEHYYKETITKNYANFNGRASREEFWMFVLANLIAAFCIGFIGGMIGIKRLGNLYSLAVLVPGIAIAVRRIHDVNKSGWFVLVPIYNLILVLTKGTHGHNKFGDIPHELK